MTRPGRVTTVTGVALVAVALTLLGVAAVAWLGSGSRTLGPRSAPGALDAALGRARPAVAPFPGLTEVALGIAGRCHRLVVADSVDERTRGLMGRRDLGPYDGMLFVFPLPSHDGFTMSDVPVALDIGFYDESGRPVDQLVMEPCPDRSPSECPVYRSRSPNRYALETLRGGLPSGALGSCSS